MATLGLVAALAGLTAAGYWSAAPTASVGAVSGLARGRHSHPAAVARPVPVVAAGSTAGRPATSPPPPNGRGPVSPTSPLQVALAGLVAGHGCLLATRAGLPVAEVATDQPVAPASTQKLVTAAAALSVLGPGYRFVTRVEAAAPLRPGAPARLWLVGSGDPMLSTATYRAFVARTDHYPEPPPFTPLEWLANDLRAAGLRAVSGGITGDESAQSDQRYLPTWKPIYLQESDVGPLSALSINEGWQDWTRRIAPSTDPPQDAAGTLGDLLQARGVTVAGPPSAGVAPPDAVSVASVASVPLAQIVAYMLATSDNHIAELLTRTVGQYSMGVGTTPAGTAAIVSRAAALGLPTRSTAMVDGSGLSPQNRATCSELWSAYELGVRPSLASLRSGLPVAGRTGTLYREWRGTALAGRLVAKTGWIDGAAGLVGTLSGPRPVDFALVLNGNFDYAAAHALQTTVLQALATATAS